MDQVSENFELHIAIIGYLRFYKIVAVGDHSIAHILEPWVLRVLQDLLEHSVIFVAQAYLRRDAFDAREEDFYQALYTQSQSQFNTWVYYLLILVITSLSTILCILQ